MQGLAIVSVWDKRSLEPFVRGLCSLGYGILSTGGTAKFLGQCGLEHQLIEHYTGQPEILDGRVKTLHPKIHGGILARRDLPNDIAQIEGSGILPIEMVVVNLYPFTDKVREVEAAGQIDHPSLVEFIDIGGPTMIRAAAKNWRFVVPVCDPDDYEPVLAELRQSGAVSLATRRRLAAKVFRVMAAYDGAIARYFSLGERLLDEAGNPPLLAPVDSYVLEKKASLRYGENPHQQAALYSRVSISGPAGAPAWVQLQGKELSYNNLLDMQGAAELFLQVWRDLGDGHAAVIIKHSNPCGAAIRKTNIEAFTAARECDPLSAFGGIIAVSGAVNQALAAAILEGFVEVLLVGELDSAAKELFATKKNLRLIQCDFARLSCELEADGITMRSFFNDLLVQTRDAALVSLCASQSVTEKKPSAQMLADLSFAWKICKHVKSNTIVIVKDLQAIGVGAGQMSRVDAARFAIQRAAAHGFSTAGAVAASDAFLPFSDTLDVLNDSGVVGLVQPGGSLKDAEVIAAADARGVVMLMTGERHFRH